MHKVVLQWLTFGLIVVLFSTPSWGRELFIGGSLNVEYQILTESQPYQAQQVNTLMLDLGSYSGATNLVIALELSNPGNGLQLREAYGELYTANIDWRVGRQLIPWGVMDGASPIDIINPVDYTRPFAANNRLGVTALRAQHYTGGWEIEGVWVPSFTPHKLPEDLPNHQLPENTVGSGEAGLRISRWLLGMDIAASYYYGWDKNPRMQAHQSTNQLSFTYERQHMIGASITKVLGATIGRGEVAYFLPEQSNPYLQYAVGFDRNLTNDLYLITQLGSTIGSKQDQMGITCALQYQASTHVSIKFNGMYSITDQGFMLNPALNWDVADGLELSTGLYYVDGDVDSALSRFKSNQHIYLGVTYSF